MRLSARVGAFEITNDEVRLAVVNTGGKQPTLLEYHAALPVYAGDDEPGAAVVGAIKRVVASVKARPSLYVLCLNSQSTVVRTLTVPFRGRNRVSAAVPVELEPNLAFPIDDLIIDYTVIRELPKETEVLAVAVKQALLEEQLGWLRAADVVVEGVNLDAAGLATLWLSGQRKPNGVRAQVHVRDESALLTVLNGRNLVFFRHIPLTAGRFINEPRLASRDVRNTLRAFATGWRGEGTVEDLTVTGIDLDGAAREAFEEGIQVPVSYLSLAAYLRGVDKALDTFRAAIGSAPTELSPSPLLDHNRWEAAAGVALASAGSGVAYELLKGPLAPQNPLAAMKGKLIGTAALALITIAGAVGYTFASYRNNMAELDRIGNEIWTIYATTFPEDPAVKDGRPEGDLGGIKSMALLDAAYTSSMNAGARLSPELLARPPLLAILKEIAEKLPSDKVQITELRVRDIRGNEQALTIQGEVLDPNGFQVAFENLKQSTLLKEVEEPTRSTKDNVTTFTITAVI